MVSPARPTSGRRPAPSRSATQPSLPPQRLAPPLNIGGSLPRDKGVRRPSEGSHPMWLRLLRRSVEKHTTTPQEAVMNRTQLLARCAAAAAAATLLAGLAAIPASARPDPASPSRPGFPTTGTAHSGASTPSWSDATTSPALASRLRSGYRNSNPLITVVAAPPAHGTQAPRCSPGISGFSPRTLSSWTAHVLPSGSLKPKKVPPLSGVKCVMSLTSTPRSRSPGVRRGRRRPPAGGHASTTAPSRAAQAGRRQRWSSRSLAGQLRHVDVLGGSCRGQG
jgi:hypothetical protein